MIFWMRKSCRILSMKYRISKFTPCNIDKPFVKEILEEWERNWCRNKNVKTENEETTTVFEFSTKYPARNIPVAGSMFQEVALKIAGKEGDKTFWQVMNDWKIL